MPTIRYRNKKENISLFTTRSVLGRRFSAQVLKYIIYLWFIVFIPVHHSLCLLHLCVITPFAFHLLSLYQIHLISMSFFIPTIIITEISLSPVILKKILVQWIYRHSWNLLLMPPLPPLSLSPRHVSVRAQLIKKQSPV